jgi:hypothetical protein
MSVLWAAVPVLSTNQEIRRYPLPTRWLAALARAMVLSRMARTVACWTVPPTVTIPCPRKMHASWPDMSLASSAPRSAELISQLKG